MSGRLFSLSRRLALSRRQQPFVNQRRALHCFSPFRPSTLLPFRPAHVSPSVSIFQSAPVTPRSETIDVLPKISTHPALAGQQVRNGPRDTYNPSHFVRKRRHGFLARKRTRTGRAILKRRRLKGRKSLSH